jgi:hypothetical protein
MNRPATIRNPRSVLAFAALAAVLLLMLPAPARAQWTAGPQVSAGPEMLYITSNLCVAGAAQANSLNFYGVPLYINATTLVSSYSSCKTASLGKQFASKCDLDHPGFCVPTHPTPQPSPPVTWVLKTMPVGSLAVMQQLYLDVNGTKTYCSTPLNWQYSTVAESSMAGLSNGPPACGAGNYGMASWVYVWDGKAWQGGSFWTPDVYIL